MAVDVTIKGKGIFKKTFKIEDILDDDMSYGIMDEAFRLDENQVGEHTVLFKRDKMCRGFEVTLKKGAIDLRMPLPTSNEDIKYFYEYINKLCGIMKTNKFIREGEVCTFDLIDEFIKLDTDTSIMALKEIKKNIETKGGCMYIFGALNPIAVGKKEIDFIGNNPNKLGELLNRLQNMDVYYAKPTLYTLADNTVMGVYSIVDENPSVLPYKATVPFDNEITVNKWIIGLVIDEELAGFIPYDDFIKNVKKFDEYDTEHFIAKINSKEMNKLLAKYKLEI